MVLLNLCTTKWHHVIESGIHAFRSSRLLQSQPTFAKGRALSSFTTLKSSSHWFSRRLGPQPGSSRQHTRQQNQTCLCNSQLITYSACCFEAEHSKLQYLQLTVASLYSFKALNIEFWNFDVLFWLLFYFAYHFRICSELVLNQEISFWLNYCCFSFFFSIWSFFCWLKRVLFIYTTHETHE